MEPRHKATPTPRQIDDALAVIHSPQLVANQPAMRTHAWATLKAERGQTVNERRLSRMQTAIRHTGVFGRFLHGGQAI